MKRLTLLLLLFFALIPAFLRAQSGVTANATLDSTNILIGDHLNLRLTISAPKNAPIVIPQFVAEQFESFELVHTSPIDTQQTEAQTIYNQIVTITAFDSGRYVFPAIPIFAPDSTLLALTDSLTFNVATIAVDTTAAIRDIKQPVRVPLTFQEILPYILIALVAAGIIFLLIFLIIKYNRRKRPQKTVAKPKPKIKADVAALEELEKLRQKKLWQDGKVKRYYSELTDILRQYLAARWGINAMEMPSNDILSELAKIKLPRAVQDKIAELLTTADLVKFAKSEPLPNEHENCFQNTRTFVIETAENQEVTDNKPTENA